MIEYTDELKKLFKMSELEKLELNHKYVNAEHFVLSVLKYDCNLSTELKLFGITYEKYKEELIKRKKENDIKNNTIIYSTTFKKIIENSSCLGKGISSKKITPTHIFISILEEADILSVKILESLNVDVDELYIKLKKLLNNKGELFLKEIGINLVNKASNNELDRTIGREKEITRIIEILARKNKNNPILIGEAGVGKTAIVEELARRIYEQNVPNVLKNVEIISISMSSLVAGTKYRGEFEEKLGKVIKELENNPNIILFVDEIHTLVGAGGAEGAIDASNILKPALARNNIKLIGATTLNEYKKYIEKDKALDRRFQKVYVEETNKEETLNILKKIKKDYEKYHNVKISEELLTKIVELSNRYIHDRKEPDRSIDVLDEICARSKVSFKNIEYDKLLKKKQKLSKEKRKYIEKENYEKASLIKKEELSLEKEMKRLENISRNNEVTLDDLEYVLELKSNSYIVELKNKENRYKKLKHDLKQNIKGQNNIIDDLVDIISRKDLKLNKDKPLSIIFNGTTGIGKTLCAKKLSEFLKYNLVKLDMTEYNSEMSINKILGASQGYVGYDEVNTVFESIKDKPNSLILLDEFDKANNKVKNLFYNILDEGILKNSKNEIINFKNCIFILTTNNLNKKENIGFNKEVKKKDINTFNTELLNRIDYILEFNNLTKDDLIQIINSEIRLIVSKYKLDNAELGKIIEESNYKIYGARKIKNLIIKHLSKKYIKI